MKGKKYTFTCHVSNPDFVKTIKAPEKEIKSLRDVKSKIASTLNIKTTQFTIDNQPKDKKISSFLDNYKFEITITERCTDITFNLPNGNQVNIPNCYKMTTDQVLE